ncbi:MAG: hypothetical protein U0Z75_03245 [Deinococcaceae bacterium]
MKLLRAHTVVLGMLAGLALAADAVTRTIEIEGDYQGDVRNGPWNYSGTVASPVKAKVSNLSISSTTAKLSAPSGTPMATAKGQRDAEFTGSVKVSRTRVAAEGSSLKYSEKTGIGLLTGQAQSSMVYTPDGKDVDTVKVTADSMSFDVDTSESTSSGNVQLINGRQTAVTGTLKFNEKTELAELSGKVTLVRQPSKQGENVLNITGDTAKIQTNKDKKLLLVNGKEVKLVDGNVTTTGLTIYYDDKKNTAVIVGNPAKSFDSKSKTTLQGGTLEHRTDLHRARVLSGGFKIPVEQFK